MEKIIPSINDPYTFLAFFLLLAYLTFKEIVPLLKAKRNGSKPVSNADLKLAILEHCANCSRIGDVDEKITKLHDHIDERFNEIQGEVRKVWQHLAASKV